LRRAQALLDVLREVAETHHATPAQISLAWLIRRPNVVVIPGASSAAQVEVNAAAADIELTDDEDDALVAASDAFEPLAATAVLPDLIRERFSGFLGRMTGGTGGGPASS
jgi:aryl-alcohol dehydrogenase-like predicted oxidoreductase